ncbi:MAG: LCP family protein [Anaerolineae bacterium]|nr:MAG: LCP family protein [Anaerolineae bacterium]
MGAIRAPWGATAPYGAPFLAVHRDHAAGQLWRPSRASAGPGRRRDGDHGAGNSDQRTIPNRHTHIGAGHGTPYHHTHGDRRAIQRHAAAVNGCRDDRGDDDRAHHANGGAHATRTPRPLDQTFNILLLGSDQRPGEHAWRTDTIMIAAVDFPNKRIGLVSLPRDLWLDIPGYGKSRINMADFVGEYEVKYPGGGPALLQRVISDTFGIPVQRYIRMNLTAFERAIDTIGGVTVNIECPLLEATPDPHNPDKLVEVYYDVGPHHFDGREARLYASYRYYTGDWDARRQQQVLMAIREQALRSNMITKVPELWVTFHDAFQTDLTLKEVLDLTTFGLLQMDMKDVHGVVIDYRLVTPYTTAGGGAVLLPKIPEITQAVDNIFTVAPLRDTVAQPAAGCRTKPRVTATPTPTTTPTTSPPPEN